MIDVSQWRASIGLWNYCQAASSRPANGHHSHSFKAAVDSKPGSTTSGEKTSKLPAALSLIVSLLLSLLRCIKLNFIPPTGIITGTVMKCLQSLVLFIATIGSSSDLIYYLVLLLLLLLSGDVELNPGPITGIINRVWNWIRTKIFRCLQSNQGNQYSGAIPPNTADKDLNMAAVTQIFNSSAHHYLTIGTGLGVYTADLMPIPGQASTNLNLVFQRWFDADRDVSWDTLIKLCDDYPDQLGRAKSNLLAYIGQSIPDNVSSHTVLPSPVDDISNIPEEKKFQIEDLIKSGTLKRWCKEGIMKLTLTRVLMIGPAGSGKTCAQCLLLNEPPPLKAASSSDPQTDFPPATSLPLANPLISSDSTTEVQSSGLTPHSIVSKSTTDSTPIACKAVKALRIAFDDGTETWKRITRDELLQKLASSLKEAANKASQQNDSQSTTETTDLEKTPEEHYDSPGDVVKEIADLLPNAEAQLSEKWVYIVDSGGQPAFQELLPLFTRAATLNVITLDISKDVDEEFEFMYRINREKFPCDKGMKYSNRKIFNSVVSSAFIQKPININFVKQQPKHSMSFVLGTHYDVLINKTNKEDAETKVVEMSEKLMSPKNILPHLKSRVISKVHRKSVIYPVNTMQQDKRKEISGKILEIMSKCTEVTIEIDVPIRFFAFELYLEEKAKSKGFVTKDEAIEEGKKLYMNDDDVEIALIFLHTSTIILYYSDIKPQLVFVDPQKIINVLSHLLALTYVDYPTPATSLAPNISLDEMTYLTNEGCFNEVLLEKFKDVFSDHFTPKYFINLLQHLHIIKSQAQIGDDSYFLPSALPAYNNSYDKDLPESIKPLYYVWREQEGKSRSKNYVLVPQGIFSLIFVHMLHLLEQKEHCDEMEFTHHPKYRDAFSLWIYIKGKRCTLYIINNHSRHIEVYFKGPENYCPQVRKLITTTIDTSSDAINTKQNYVSAFPCPNRKDQCYCIVNEECKVAYCSMCDSNDFSESDKSYWCWFHSSSAADKAKSIEREETDSKETLGSIRASDAEHNPDPITDKKLNMAAVKKILGSSDEHYLTIGSGLDVKTADLIEMQGTASTKLHLVFQRWFNAGRDVNWDTLINLCDDFPKELGKAKSILLAYIGAKKDKRKLAETDTRAKKLKVEDEDEDMPDIN